MGDLCTIAGAALASLKGPSADSALLAAACAQLSAAALASLKGPYADTAMLAAACALLAVACALLAAACCAQISAELAARKVARPWLCAVGWIASASTYPTCGRY